MKKTIWQMSLPLLPFLIWWLNDLILVHLSTIAQAPWVLVLALAIVAQKIIIPAVIYGLLLFADKRLSAQLVDYRRNATMIIMLMLVVDIFLFRNPEIPWMEPFAERHNSLMDALPLLKNQTWAALPLLSIAITAQVEQWKSALKKKFPATFGQ